MAKDAKQNISNLTSAGVDIGGRDELTDTNIKLLNLLWKRHNRTSFDKKSDFILAVQLRRIKLINGEFTSILSMKKASMADGNAKVCETISNPNYDGIDDSISDAEENFIDEIEKLKDQDGDDLLIPDVQGDESS